MVFVLQHDYSMLHLHFHYYKNEFMISDNALLSYNNVFIDLKA